MSKTTRLKSNPSLRQPKMQHIRNVKPEYFVHEGVNDMTTTARYAEIGTWTCCDKHGRFEWQPRTLKRQVMPYDAVDFESLMMEWVNHGFCERYEVNGQQYGRFFNWEKHQSIGSREKDSTYAYPEPPSILHSASTVQAQCLHDASTRDVRAMSEGIGVGKGIEEGEVEGKGKQEREGKVIAASAAAAPSADVAVGSKPTLLSPSLDVSTSKAPQEIQEHGHSQSDTDVATIQALCFNLTCKTPKPEHVRALLDLYRLGEIEEALRWYVKNLANPKKDLQWAEKTFFQDGGAHGIILAARQSDWKDELQSWSERTDFTGYEDEWVNQTLEQFLEESPVPNGIPEWGERGWRTLTKVAWQKRQQHVTKWKSQNPPCEKCEARGEKLVGGLCADCVKAESAKPELVEPEAAESDTRMATPEDCAGLFGLPVQPTPEPVSEPPKPAPIKISASMSEEEMRELFKKHGVEVKPKQQK